MSIDAGLLKSSSGISILFNGPILAYFCDGPLRWLPTIPENVKLLRTHSPVTKFILNTPKTGQCEYFQEKHEGHYCTYNEKQKQNKRCYGNQIVLYFVVLMLDFTMNEQ